ncbi:hypothetical protein ACH5RR_013276 [Cinchona calisaya]|uniref:NADH-quinone oxidoreductase subunit D domain-containing protein n=1 Tax=Cinchona calisaya TaxID=153742 RepID=A0ABD2ZZM8_9GENT
MGKALCCDEQSVLIAFIKIVLLTLVRQPVRSRENHPSPVRDLPRFPPIRPIRNPLKEYPSMNHAFKQPLLTPFCHYPCHLNKEYVPCLGSAHAISLGLCRDIDSFTQQFASRIDEFEEISTGNRIWKQRLVDIGTITTQQANNGDMLTTTELVALRPNPTALTQGPITEKEKSRGVNKSAFPSF